MGKVTEFTEQEIERYVKKHGLFPEDAKLNIRNVASGRDDTEGLVNLICRVEDVNTGRTLIFKQVMPYVLALMKHSGELLPTGKGRTIKEVRAMVLMDVIYSGITPKVYFQDEKQGIICMEDVSHLKNMRFQLANLQQFPDFGIRIGAFLAEMLFFTSDLYLDAQTKWQWEQLLMPRRQRSCCWTCCFRKAVHCLMSTDHLKRLPVKHISVLPQIRN